MMGIVFDGGDAQLRVLGQEPDGGIAAEGAQLETVGHVEHATLEGEEFALDDWAVDGWQATGLGLLEG